MTTVQRINLKFLVRLGKSPSEAPCRFQQVCKEQSFYPSTVFLWHKRFKKGSEDVEDDSMRRRPSTSTSETNFELVKKMVCEDCRLSMLQISNELGLNRNSIWRVITDLGMRKVCAKMVPRWFHTWHHPQHPHFLL